MAPRIPISQAVSVGQVLRLTGPEARHIRTVLRLKPGDALVLCDGTQEYTGTITTATTRAVDVDIVAAHTPATESPLRLVLAQALLKGPKMDLVIEKATELGASV